MIVGDLKKCEMYPNWREQAQDRSICRCWIKAANEDVNGEMEITEQSKKDELKQRGEAVNQEQTLSGWRCSEQGCHFVGSNKGLYCSCGANTEKDEEEHVCLSPCVCVCVCN